MLWQRQKNQMAMGDAKVKFPHRQGVKHHNPGDMWRQRHGSVPMTELGSTGPHKTWLKQLHAVASFARSKNTTNIRMIRRCMSQCNCLGAALQEMCEKKAE